MSIKNENFNRISDARLKKVTQLLKQISNLSNSSYYEYSVDDVNRIIDVIEDELYETKIKLMNSKALNIQVKDCNYKSVLEQYLKVYKGQGDAGIGHSLNAVFSTVNWQVIQNKTMQNTNELIEFAFIYCDGLDIDDYYSHYVYNNLGSLKDILRFKYEKDDSDLMKRVKNGIETMRRITSLSFESFFENPQNALDVYGVILGCFDAIKDRDFVYRLLIGMVESQKWKKKEGIEQEYYFILEKTVSAWE